jgi:hypothetical protein
MSDNAEKIHRPNKWKHKDPFDHERYIPYLRAKNQAVYRLEDWALSFGDFCSLWTPGAWSLRGRGSSDLAMIRLDTDKPWCLSNCQIATRKEQLARQLARQKEKKQQKVANLA